MSDKYTENLLTEWGFIELIETFRENAVDEEAFDCLTPDLITQLIPKIGVRAKFLSHFNSYISIKTLKLDDMIVVNGTIQDQILNTVYNTSSSTSSNSTETINSVPSTSSNCSSTENIVVNVDEIKNSYSCATKRQNAFYGESQMKRACYQSYNLNLHEFLSNSSPGKLILKTYNQNKILDRKTRNLLVHIIINAALANSPNMINEDFQNLSDKIVDLFPNECKETYYLPGVKAKNSFTKKSINAKGKLIDKYKNLKRLYCKNDVMICDNESSDVIPSTSDISANLEDSKSWLHSTSEPWDLVENHWEISFPLRRLDKSVGVDDFLKTWPILNNPKGHTLINKDFMLLQPEAKYNLFSNWNHFFNKLNEISPSKSKNDELLTQLMQDLNEDCRYAIQIMVLSSLLPPNSRIKNKKGFWKPSILEAQQSIINHIKNPADIETCITSRRNKLKELNLPLLPFIIVVGNNLANLTDFYISIDTLLYKVSSTLQALDICFKSFHSFHMLYPPESEHLWLLIQLVVYKFKTKWDKQIPLVHEIIKQLNITI